MALEANCKLCRREGIKLFLKGERCNMAKCPIERQRPAPGTRRFRRRKLSPYAVQLREKQRLKRLYGLREKQFKNYVTRSMRKKGVTGEMLLQFLETRLDNLVYRLGFAVARKGARQIVTHGHVLVNGKKMDIPSCGLKEGDVVEVKSSSRSRHIAARAFRVTEKREVPGWLRFDRENFRGELLRIPSGDEIDVPVSLNLIIEFYSK